MSNNALEQAEAAAAQAHDEAAIGLEFAEDYRMIGNLKLYYATAGHKWVLMKLSTSAFRELDNSDRAAIIVYVLSHKMPDSLTRLAAEMRTMAIYEKALHWINANNIDPDVCLQLQALLEHPYNSRSDEEPEEDPTPPAP